MEIAMKIKIIVALLCMFCFISSPSTASDWYWIGNDQGENEYIDNSSVQKNDDHAIVWAKITGATMSNGEMTKEILFKMLIKKDCSGGWYYMQIIYPDGDLQKIDNNLEIHPFPPDSFGHKIWEYVY